MAELAERLSRDRPGYLLWTLGTPTDSVVDHARRAARIAPPESGFRLVPLLVAPGAHFHKDVAALAEAVALAAPTLRPVVLPAFLQDGDFVSWFLSRLP